MTFQTTLKRLLLAAAFCLPATLLFAQTSTQGAIGGTIFDTTDAVIPNASIVIHNNGTNADVTLTADASGFFKAPLLEPGTYTVTISAAGFGSYKADRVLVQVGQLTTISTHLTAGGENQKVDVSSDVPVLNFDSPDFESNINQRALENIPVNNRRWSSLALLTPGVVVDSSGFGLVSVRGISTILNNVEIDGADDNQAYFAEERGRTREAYSTSAAAVREFEVNTGVYPAEYGRAAGGVINSVTKSGTNDIHGQAYFYDRESKWNAFNDQSTLTTLNPATGTNITTPLKPEDVRKIYGFTVGGPIRKDKIFFLYTYDQHSRIFPLLAVPANPAVFYAAPDANLPAGSSCSLTTGYLSGAPAGTNTLDAQVCTMAARLNQTYTQAVSTYNTGIANLNSDLGIIPRTGYQEINQPKLDYQISPKEHVSFLYNRLRWDSPGGVQTNATGTYSLDATGTDFVKLDYGVAKLTSLFTPTISNELLYQYGRELNDEGQYPLSAYSKNFLQTANGNVPYTLLDSGTGFYLGSPYYSYRPKYPDERKWQIGDTLYYTRGNNSFKFGTDTVHNYDLTNQAQYYEGYYQYSTNLANFITDLNAKNFSTGVCDAAQQTAAASATKSAVGTSPCYTSYTQDFGPTTFDFATLDYGFFGQDNWKITPRLTLELGVRYDYESLPNAVAALTAPYLASTGYQFEPFNGINNNPSDKNNIGPRIGFAYDVFGAGKTVLRGGYGLYYGRITNGNEGTALATTGSPLAQSAVVLKPGAANAPRFPNTIPAATLSGSAGSSAYFRAPNLQNPQIHEFDLQVQQEIGHGTEIQVAYLAALGRQLPNFLDVNLNPAQTTVAITIADTTGKSPIPNGTVLQIPTFTSYGNTALLGPNATNFSSITELISNINSSYNALTAEIQNRSLRSIQWDLNYTWSHALDFYQNSSTAGNTNNWFNPYASARSNYGNGAYDVPNRLTGYALYNFPNLEGHQALKYATNDWSLDDTFQIQSELPFSAGVSGNNSTSAVASGLNGNGGVTYIPQLGINTYRQRRIIVDDIRVEKQFAFTERYRLQVFLQAFNLANHQNVSSVNSTAFKLTSVSGNTTAGTATYQSNFGTVNTTNNSGFSYTPRELELSARFSF